LASLTLDSSLVGRTRMVALLEMTFVVFLFALAFELGATKVAKPATEASACQMVEGSEGSCSGMARDSLLLQIPRLDLHRAGADKPLGLLDESDDPVWGCGLVGSLPGISQDGQVADETQRLIDGIKGSSSFNKATFWNWGLAPQTTGGTEEHLSKDFIFMPEEWGIGPVNEQYLRPAGQANFLDSNGKTTPATMATLLLGMNEPDIIGSCMGNLFGKCVKPCSQAAVETNNCPAAYPFGSEGEANSAGECNCWQHSYASGVGFWPVQGCSAEQPLPSLFDDAVCVDRIMDNWRQTAAIASRKGYKYLSTPLVAVDIGYARKFIERACAECHDASCGCPVYVGFHFYAFDCQPEATGGYDAFRKRLADVAAVMEDYPFVKGAIINEVGMLNCASDPDKPICVPNNGDFPAINGPNHGCPPNKELPNGLASFMDKLFDIMLAAKTLDGRPVVKGFSWFNEHEAGGTYNLELFDRDGSVNELGEAYIRGCSRWGSMRQ